LIPVKANRPGCEIIALEAATNNVRLAPLLRSRKEKRKNAMLLKSKIAVGAAVAVVLSTASAAISAPKHPVRPIHHQQTVTKRYVPPAAYQSFGFVRGSVRPSEPGYMRFQDQGVREDLGG
jgi:hypothetical protein